MLAEREYAKKRAWLDRHCVGEGRSKNLQGRRLYQERHRCEQDCDQRVDCQALRWLLESPRDRPDELPAHLVWPSQRVAVFDRQFLANDVKANLPRVRLR